jgi:hypothetical protein
MLERGRRGDISRLARRERLRELLERLEAPVLQGWLELEERYGGTTFHPRGYREVRLGIADLGDPVVRRGAEGWLAECCEVQVEPPFHLYADPAGRFFAGDRWAEFAVADSIATWIESLAMEDELHDRGVVWAASFGSTARGDPRLIEALGPPVAEASDGFVRWWDGPARVRAARPWHPAAAHDVVHGWASSPEAARELVALLREAAGLEPSRPAP